MSLKADHQSSLRKSPAAGLPDTLPTCVEGKASFIAYLRLRGVPSGFSVGKLIGVSAVLDS